MKIICSNLDIINNRHLNQQTLTSTNIVNTRKKKSYGLTNRPAKVCQIKSNHPNFKLPLLLITITSNNPNYRKIYTGTTELNFKQILDNHAKTLSLEHYENNTKLYKEQWLPKQSFHTRTHLENNKEMGTFQHNQKKRLSVSP